MLRSSVFAFILAVSAALGTSAQASYINFSFLGTTTTGAGLSGAGVINLSDGPPGTYLATSGQLAVFGDTSVSQAFLTANPNGFGVAHAPGVPGSDGIYDNVIYGVGATSILNGPTGQPVAAGLNPRIDPNGLYFLSGSNAIFLYASVTGVQGGTITAISYSYFDYDIKTGQFLRGDNISLSFGSVLPGTAPIVPANSTPEPGSWLMLGMGCVGLAPFVRKRLGERRAVAA